MLFCLVETEFVEGKILRIKSHICRNTIRSTLIPKKDKYQRTAFLHSNSVIIVELEECNGISAFKIMIPDFVEYLITIALLYKSINTPVNSFIDLLTFAINVWKIDMLVGDVNIDTFNGDVYARLGNVMNDYD